ncbi:MAG: hypothetical protein ACQGVC_17075 [Myxococcota bacterium]
MPKKAPESDLPPVKTLHRKRVVRCKTCRYDDGRARRWISAVLQHHIDDEQPQPRLKDLYEAACEAFPGTDEAPGFESTVASNSMLQHLIRDEPLWVSREVGTRA